MAARRTLIPTVILAAFIVLFLPAFAAAQGGNDPWWRDRDYGRGRDRRNDDNYGRYDRNRVRDSARRVESLSNRFVSDLDRSLDRSRVNGTNREDRINDQARDFSIAADRFRNRVGDARDLNRSINEARNLLQIAARVDRIMSRLRFDSRTESTWVQIRQELRVIADAYGFRNGDFGYGNGGGRGGRWPY